MGTLAQAALAERAHRERNRRLADKAKNTPLDHWLRDVSPTYNWDWPHIRYVREALDRVTSGKSKRLMIFLPPRHGKSALTTVRYPAYYLQQDPNRRVIVGCYSQELAALFSRQTRRIAKSRVPLSTDRAAATEWETTTGGGLVAVGVGTGVVGRGANLIIIDDSIKGRKEAMSQKYKDDVWDWYTNDILTRQEPGCAIINIQTRWVDDDLAGRILASEEGSEWEVVKLPALAEMNDPLGRMEGEALCPERFDVAALRKIQRMQKTDFNALYQQSPVPRGGGKFKRDWFTIVDRAPAIVQRVITYWDKAGTEGDGDYTVGICMSLATDGIVYIEFMWRDQLGDLARERLIKQATQITQRRRPLNITWLETEGGSAGISDSNATIRALAGFTVYAERPSGSKIVRATPFASYAEAGDVRLVKGDWNEDFLQEMALFPVGRHDDIVDASSGAFNKLFSGAVAGNVD